LYFFPTIKPDFRALKKSKTAGTVKIAAAYIKNGAASKKIILKPNTAQIVRTISAVILFLAFFEKIRLHLN
jgi:hypothetical protein